MILVYGVKKMRAQRLALPRSKEVRRGATTTIVTGIEPLPRTSRLRIMRIWSLFADHRDFEDALYARCHYIQIIAFCLRAFDEGNDKPWMQTAKSSRGVA